MISSTEHQGSLLCTQNLHIKKGHDSFPMHKSHDDDPLHVILAEREGFEPPIPEGMPVFKTGAISQTLPSLQIVVLSGFEPPTPTLSV